MISGLVKQSSAVAAIHLLAGQGTFKSGRRACLANILPCMQRGPFSLVAVLEQAGQLDGALGAVERAIAVNPSSYEAYRNRGMLFEKRGRFDEAIADYTRAVNLRPTYHEAYNSRGLVYAKMGQFDKAIADFSETIRINPGHFGAYVNRGVAYTLAGQYDKAL